MGFRDEKKQTLPRDEEETRSALNSAPLSEREKRSPSVATFPLYGPVDALDNPPPFELSLAGHETAPWHAYGDVAKWEPEFRALASALDRGRALGEWNLAFAHLRAGARRALACCRAEQYAHFAELLEQLAADEPNPMVTLTRAEPHSSDAPGVGGVSSDDTRALRLSTLREKLATSETDHAARILRVTFGRRAVAEKQLRSGLRDRKLLSEASSNANDDELNEDEEASLRGFPHGESDMADPPTLAEMLAATRVLRGIWVHAPASCAAAGAAGAAGALTRALEPAGAPPPPPRDSPSDLLQRALEQWRLDQGLEADDEKRSGRGSRPSDDIADTAFVSSSSPPPLKVAFPEGKGEDGSTNASLVSIGWDVEDPELSFGQPSLDVVRCEILEALLSLMARDERSQSAFVKRGGVFVVAGYLVPWLALESDEAPGELVQRCIVFLGVLIRHVLPTTGTDADAESGQGLAARAEATLEATIGAETTAEILEAAAHLHDVGDEGENENENENDADASGDDASESASPYGVSPRRPSSREAARFRV